MSDILTSWIFWVFGGGIVLSIIKVLSGRFVELQKIRAQERHWRRQQDVDTERRMLGMDEPQEIAGLKLRVEALEAEITRLKQNLGGTGGTPLKMPPPSTLPAAGHDNETRLITQ